MGHAQRGYPREAPFGLFREASPFDYFSGTSGSNLTKCQSGVRINTVKALNNADNAKCPRNSPQIPAFAVTAEATGRGRIPPRLDARASSPMKINCRKFTE